MSRQSKSLVTHPSEYLHTCNKASSSDLGALTHGDRQTTARYADRMYRLKRGSKPRGVFFHNRYIGLIIQIDSLHWDEYQFLDLDKFCNIQSWVENIKECVTKSVSG